MPRSPQQSLENLIKIQRDCVSPGYMHGLLNGLVLSHSIVVNKNCSFDNLPLKTNKVRHKSSKSIRLLR